MWSRSLSTLGSNSVFAGYYAGTSHVTTVAAVSVDPASHHLSEKSKTALQQEGFTPFVRTVSLPAGEPTKRTVVLYHPEVGQHQPMRKRK